ncbi:MAG: hypothetical protein EWV49_08830 [Microcystis aeruginosa Ma_QC_Ch_20071001_S25]|jgi:hypothetical protein|uniref:Uncharacterized protein n=1 Tax=Microcystis aeruginosa Ma_QC_Ch_20071001_S25D TaxID=2486250 RepID=A0A552FRY8_MICAE|nr:MAG: hypothetical protein EWV57_12280 [Microcystis aeruginosa Ma_QC_Ch_20071001_S25D]TRU50693.1 MAG: hypothetical protein EWV49_08830 [Microcystis aeruginosa Ma_QC_Ch_20071001_S25]TRU62492.1 MAG: hypothetical protein EWV90_10770 [Microcystis aeruginosa Ma_QC_Ch_20071001_M135]
MFGTRNLFHKAAQVSLAITNPQNSEPSSSPHLEFLSRIYQQSKQISQIVTYIWRWADDTTNSHKKAVAIELKQYFDNPTTNTKDIGGKLKVLFQATPKNSGIINDPSYLLWAVFEEDATNNENYIFPMFDEFELGTKIAGLGYWFEVKVDAFHGTLDDPDGNDPHVFKFNIPYPPRPCIGEATVTTEELQAWIENREKFEYFAKNPYIPTTCC